MLEYADEFAKRRDDATPASTSISPGIETETILPLPINDSKTILPILDPYLYNSESKDSAFTHPFEQHKYSPLTHLLSTHDPPHDKSKWSKKTKRKLKRKKFSNFHTRQFDSQFQISDTSILDLENLDSKSIEYQPSDGSNQTSIQEIIPSHYLTKHSTQTLSKSTSSETSTQQTIPFEVFFKQLMQSPLDLSEYKIQKTNDNG